MTNTDPIEPQASDSLDRELDGGEMIPVEYGVNNSGGGNWLSRKKWQALQDAGWLIFDLDNNLYTDKGEYVVENGLPKAKTPADLDSAHSAYKMFPSIKEALKEFEEITGEDVSCGALHSFTWGRDIIERVALEDQDYNYASGEDLLQYMFDSAPTELTKRQLLEKFEEQK